MKITKYIKDKIYFILIFLFTFVTTLLLFFAFKVQKQVIICTFFLFFFTFFLSFIIDFYRKKKFYNEFLMNLERLDKKYLILEMIEKPNFYEGTILYDSLYEINKSMLENVKEFDLSVRDFKEYIEMWIHEIKVPVSFLTLMAHNRKDIDKKFVDEIRRIDNLIEQVLYYVRSENAEKDYLIKENKLSKIISNVALKNKNDLLFHKIDLLVEDQGISVLTDSKWLEFIMNQIINNCIKYCDKKKSKNYIKIYVEQIDEITILNIYDNGIGISPNDIRRVFEKSFTGMNGHKYEGATGMGLYISEKLCKKLGHKIEIESEEGNYTLVRILFQKDHYYDILK